MSQYAGYIEDYDGIATSGDKDSDDYMVLTVRVNTETDSVDEAKFKTNNNSGLNEIGEMICKVVSGKNIAEILEITQNDILEFDKKNILTSNDTDKYIELIHEAVHFHLYMKQAIESRSVKNKKEFLSQYKHIDNFMNKNHEHHDCDCDHE